MNDSRTRIKNKEIKTGQIIRIDQDHCRQQRAARVFLEVLVSV